MNEAPPLTQFYLITPHLWSTGEWMNEWMREDVVSDLCIGSWFMESNLYLILVLIFKTGDKLAVILILNLFLWSGFSLSEHWGCVCFPHPSSAELLCCSAGFLCVDVSELKHWRRFESLSFQCTDVFLVKTACRVQHWSVSINTIKKAQTCIVLQFV